MRSNKKLRSFQFLIMLLIGLFFSVNPARAESTKLSQIPTFNQNQQIPLLAGSTWYVSTLGDDTNDCLSPSTPCASVNAVLDNASFVEGDTIKVAIGTYTGTDTEVIHVDKKSVIISGGWNVDFSLQSGMSTFDGENARTVIFIYNPYNLHPSAALDHVIIQNGTRGIVSRGPLTLNNCEVSNNGSPIGAGIIATDELIIDNCDIHSNISYSLGGGINFHGSKLIVSNSRIFNNEATIPDMTAGRGGGLSIQGASDSIIEIKDSEIFGNSSQGAGGGIFSYSINYAKYTVNISNTTIYDNSGDGGGLLGMYGNFIIENSTIYNNNSINDGGGIYLHSGQLILTNSTVSNNQAQGTGGGIYTAYAANSISNSTIAYNSGGGINLLLSYGELPGRTELSNSIVSNNPGGDCPGAKILSKGYNIIGDASACDYIEGIGDHLNVDSGLLPLIFKDGIPQTHPVLPTSPAIDTGNPAVPGSGEYTCEVTDQRGVTRPVDGDLDTLAICDIGAFEFTMGGAAPSKLHIVEGTPQILIGGTTADPNFKVFVVDENQNAVSGAEVTFTGPASGASGTFAGSNTNVTTAVSQANGIATADGFTTNSTPGVIIINATVDGITTPIELEITNYIPEPTSSFFSSGAPQFTNLLTQFDFPLKTLVLDQQGFPLAGVTVTFTAPSSGASAVFADTSTFETTAVTDLQGIATTSAFSANASEGSYNVSATVSGIITPIQFELSNHDPIPTNINIVSGSQQLGETNTSYALPLVAFVQDQYGYPMPGVPVSFTAPAIDASGTFIDSNTNQTTALTDEYGYVTAPTFTANDILGTYFVDASIDGIADSAQFELTNFTYNPTAITISYGNNQLAELNTAFDYPLVVFVSDQFGQPMPGVLVSFTAPSSGASGTFADSNTYQTTVITDEYGYGFTTTSGFTANNISGTYFVDATVDGITSPAQFELTNLPENRVINVISGNEQKTFTEVTFFNPLSVIVTDVAGNPLEGETVVFTAPGTGASGTFADTNTNTTSAVTGADGIATAANFTANTVEGIYNVEASALDLVTSFQLNNILYVPVVYREIILDESRNLIYGSDYQNGKIHLLSSSTLSPVGFIDVGPSPSGIDISPDGNELAVASYGQGEVLFIDLDSLSNITKLSLGTSEPIDVIYGRPGRHYIIVQPSIGRRKITVINSNTKTELSSS
ncbi:MAG: hypothetical protein OEY93_04160, partial [Anaerolineae bacterium]|nr:hypothetical protein [Anaerolineae bacterium]